ncbi:MAG: DMT family transporter [Brevibacterium sp.]|uniref:DMT family transporter n=1 Tax=Brevibacterium sandarakinum TaxID=629680 RepID=UPI00264BD26B|nr:DMT family transporter [Brevibacterium sandarakinum]MDN5587996.1 DMT family transporter [Brevibacterium sp.]MDN5658151.1 DMT family transporter [Brevibacterium sandarakinum]
MKSAAALLPVLFAGLVTIAAGGAMSLQGRANGLLGPVLGHSVFAALVSFLIGLLLVGTTLLCSSRSRTGSRALIRLIRTQAMPWWMLLGGLSGGLVVIAQASTVPIMGVAMFTMAFVSGQVTGGLAVDSTRLPPGGRQRPTFLRVLGVLVVIAALVYGASERFTLGVPLWALLLPFVSGALTSVQQAFNGRIKAATGSVIVATTVNFTVGFLALLVAAGIIMASGVTWAGFPTEPAQWWMLLGGAFGVIFIGLTALTVAKLGVLLLSLFSLFGNLLGALLLDLLLPMPGSLVSPTTVISAALVLAGITITIMPSSGNRPRPSPRT